MTVELVLSVVVITFLGAMIVGDRRATPDSRWQRPPGWQGSLQRAEFLLGASIVLCLVLIWFPSGN